MEFAQSTCQMHLEALVMRAAGTDKAKNMLYFLKNHWPQCLILFKGLESTASEEMLVMLDTLGNLIDSGMPKELSLWAQSHLILSQIVFGGNQKKLKPRIKKVLRSL